MGVEFSEEKSFIKPELEKVPQKAGVYLLLQSNYYHRYKGCTRVIKIGMSGKSLQEELKNHLGRHTCSNRIKRILKAEITLTFQYVEQCDQAAAEKLEREELRRFEDEFYELPIFNSQRGYGRNEDAHLV